MAFLHGVFDMGGGYIHNFLRPNLVEILRGSAQRRSMLGGSKRLRCLFKTVEKATVVPCAASLF
jgi:hypothetical protein